MTTAPPGWPPQVRRVVIVAPRVPEASGGAVVAEAYARMFEGAGLDVEMVSVYPGTRSAWYTPTVVIRRELLHKRPVIRGGAGAWRRLWLLPVVAFKRVDRTLALRRFKRKMAGYSSDTLVVFTHVLGLALLRESGFEWPDDRPLLIGQHHSPFVDLDEEPHTRDLIARDFGDVDAFTALSTADAEEFATILPVPCFGLPNPISLSVEPSPGQGAGEPSNEKAGARQRVAVSLARYSPDKRLDIMIRAFALATHGPTLRHWRLELYGSGPEQDRLEAVIAESGASDRIALMGSIDDVRPVLATAAVNLLTSFNEGFGMSVLEAAQYAVPSIAFGSAPGVVELLTTVHGRIVLPSGDESAFVAALADELSDERALAQRGVRARAGAAAYSHEAVLARWIEILNAVRPTV
jgi:glycosyltransferase involved in cell wall biosynthesis